VHTGAIAPLWLQFGNQTHKAGEKMELRDACKKAFDGLTREYPWVGGAAIVDDGDGEYDAIPCAYLNDISYTGSRDVVAQYDSKYDIIVGTPDDVDSDDAADYMVGMID
jgi:hypothetical protein